MDISHLHNLQGALNSTHSSTASLPSTLLELVVPGYSTISQLAFRLVGIDIGVLVTGWALIFGCCTAWRYIYDVVQNVLEKHYTSSIQIDNDDDLFNYVKAWLAQQQKKKPSRKLKAVTRYEGDNGKNEDSISDEIFKYELPIPRYEPSYGSNDEVYHEGRYFKVTLSSNKDDDHRLTFTFKESLEIYCYGQTTKPIQDLLLHIRLWKVKQENSMTSVYRAAMSDGYWTRQSCRPSRPLQTVSLDQEQKDHVVEDINEFLHPATARWYAARGIPHRRGYLFHGPPGTGKTSLSFALAGVFGLHVYCVALNDKGLTESKLSSLFEDLPDRCIVLLEDIDSAGLKREEEPSCKEAKKEAEPESSKDSKNAGTTDPTSGPISLSALLNVIDGAAAHEGHVLIMTTNTPETLDAALIRPGRVDLQVGFTLATSEQIHEVFMRMYSTTLEEQAMGNRLSKLKSRHVTKIIDPATLKDMARRFTEQLPGNTLSPAEVQGYLLTRKKDPQKALDDVEQWRDEVLEAKKKGKRLVGAK